MLALGAPDLATLKADPKSVSTAQRKMIDSLTYTQTNGIWRDHVCFGTLATPSVSLDIRTSTGEPDSSPSG